MSAVLVVYDLDVFYTQDQWRNMHTQQNKVHIQSLVEDPPSSSSTVDQLALVGDSVKCLKELSKSITASNGNANNDCLRFFCDDKLN